MATLVLATRSMCVGYGVAVTRSATYKRAQLPAIGIALHSPFRS